MTIRYEIWNSNTNYRRIYPSYNISDYSHDIESMPDVISSIGEELRRTAATGSDPAGILYTMYKPAPEK